MISNSLKFFTQFPIWRFFFDLKWDIQVATVEGINLGILPILNGTIMITTIALILSIPLGIITAICITEFTSKKYANFFDIVLEIAIGIPTIVYGYFGVTFLSPLIMKIFYKMGIESNIDNALTASIGLAIMILPLITFFTRNALINVPKDIRLASNSLGATTTETAIYIVLPHAKKNIFIGILLALLKALGETLIIIMLASNNTTLSLNPLQPMTTITAQIINLINSDGEFDSIRIMVTYVLALILFLLTMILNFFISKMKE